MIDFRAAVQERLGHPAINGAAEPAIHNIDREAALRALKDRIGEIRPADPAVKPFPRAVAHLQVGGQSFDVFNDFLERPKRSEEHTSELQSQSNLVCRLLLEKKKKVHYT